MPLFKSVPELSPDTNVDTTQLGSESPRNSSERSPGALPVSDTPALTAGQQLGALFGRRNASHASKTGEQPPDTKPHNETPVVRRIFGLQGRRKPSKAETEDKTTEATTEQPDTQSVKPSKSPRRQKTAKPTKAKATGARPKAQRVSSMSKLAHKLDLKLQGSLVMPRHRRQPAAAAAAGLADACAARSADASAESAGADEGKDMLAGPIQSGRPLNRSQSLYFYKQDASPTEMPSLRHNGSSLSLFAGWGKRSFAPQGSVSPVSSADKRLSGRSRALNASGHRVSISSMGSRDDDGTASVLRSSSKPSSIRMLDRIKGKTTHLNNGFPRKSEDSASSHATTSYSNISSHHSSPPPNNSVLRGTIPFPMLRSQSSVDTKAALLQRSDASRRRTEGDIRLTAKNTGQPTTFLLAPSQEEESDSDEPSLPPPSANLSPAEYAEYLANSGFGSKICQCLAATSDEFNNLTLRAYIFSFHFSDEPLDMALRKFLFYVRLPTETQQTERVLQSFASAYQSQNDWIFAGEDQVYFLVFSLVMLHTDTFNKNVKNKMSRSDYIKTVYSDTIPVEIFEYFYDNITSCQFVNADDFFNNTTPGTSNMSRSSNVGSMLAISSGPGTQVNTCATHGASDAPSDQVQNTGVSSGRAPSGGLLSIPGSDNGNHTASGSLTPLLNGTSTRRSSSFARKDLSDPYVAIIDGTLWKLRISLSPTAHSENIFYAAPSSPHSYERIAKEAEDNSMTINLTSHRSRPDAFELDAGQNLMAELDANSLLKTTGHGVVTIKVAKLGVLLRRESKKMLSKTSWREWGVLLTRSKLYLFKNASWVKSLIAKSTLSEGLIAQVPLEEFNATITLPTQNLGALLVAAGHEQQIFPFVLISRSESFDGQSWFAGTSEGDMRDWVDMINFMGTYATYQVPAIVPQTRVMSWDAELGSAACDLASMRVCDYPSHGTSTDATAGGGSRRVFSHMDDYPHEESKHRIKALTDRLQDVTAELNAVDKETAEYERHLLHFRLLTPLSPRTRDSLQSASSKYLLKCEWNWQERARLESYKNILRMDLRAENGRRLRGPAKPPITALGD